MIEIETYDEVKIKVEPTGIMVHPRPKPSSQGRVPLPGPVNLRLAKTTPQSTQVFERMSGVISGELLSVLPGNPLQIFEAIVSEYGAQLHVAITGNFATSSMEILVHGEKLETFVELEQKIKLLMDEKRISNDAEFRDITNGKTLCQSDIKQESSTVSDQRSPCLSPIYETEEAERQFPSPPVMTGKMRQFPSPPVTTGKMRQFTSPPVMTGKMRQFPSPPVMTGKIRQFPSPPVMTGKMRQFPSPPVMTGKMRQFTSPPVMTGKMSETILVEEMESSEEQPSVETLPEVESVSTEITNEDSIKQEPSDYDEEDEVSGNSTPMTKSTKVKKVPKRVKKPANNTPTRSSKRKKQFKSSQSDFTTSTSKVLDRHKATHNTEEFTCDLCPYKAHLESLVQNHKIVKHNVENNGQEHFECPACRRKFSPRMYKLFYSHLQKHPELKGCEIMKRVEAIIEKSKEKRYVCDVCGYQTQKGYELKRHRNTVHSDNRPFVCEECGKAFKDKKNLKSHKLCHIEGGRPNWAEIPFKFFCTKCSFRSKRIQGLRKHEKRHTEQNLKINKCPDCDFTSLSQIELSKHTIIHCDDRFDCDFCSFQTHLLITLKNHLKKKHNGKDPKDRKYLNCPSCAYKVGERYCKVFLAHLKTHPELKGSAIVQEFRKRGMRFHRCNMCEFKAHTLSEVTAHKNSEHAGIKPYSCDDCGAAYKHLSDLRKHTHFKHPEIHGLQQNICNMCDMKFISEALLKRHQRTHGPGAAVFCDICEVGFPSRTQLLNHMRSFHQIGMPCPHCNKRFTTNLGLKKHLRKQHFGSRNCCDCKITENQSNNKFDGVLRVESKVCATSTQCQCAEVSTDYEILIPIQVVDESNNSDCC